MVKTIRQPLILPWYLLLYIMFLLSGFSSLVFQVVWVREFGLIFGVTTYAVGAVLSAFFAGLALGSWAVSHWSNRWSVHPLRLYGWIELAIGLYALTIPRLLSGLNGFYTTIFPLAEQSFYQLSLLRFICAVLILIIPTTLMGASLPLVAETLAQRITDVDINVSGLYAINTFGALVGSAFSGFYAIGHFGSFETMLLACGTNVIIALTAQYAAAVLAPPSGSIQIESPSTTNVEHTIQGKSRIIPIGLFLSGLAALGYEVVWTRVISIFMNGTVAAFTTILCSVLLGIVLGSWLLRFFATYIRRPMRTLAILEISVCLLNLFSIALVYLATPSQSDRTLLGIAIGIALVIPNALLGATLPLAVRIYQEQTQRVAQNVGRLYSANVLGGVLGSFATSFIFIPKFGSQQTIVLLAAINALVAILFFRSSAPGKRFVPSVLGGLSILTILFFLFQPTFMFNGINKRVYDGQTVLLNEEDIEGIVTVTEKDNARSIYVNGRLISDDVPFQVAVHRNLAHLPLLLHPDPQDMLIIGLGSGTTAGAATQHPVQDLTIVELVPGVVKGASLFERINYAVLKDPRVKLSVNDGRNYLLMNQQKFDVIEADIVLPIWAGANNLYATEYYKLIAAHLKPGGIVCQWLSRGSDSQYKMMLRTFSQVFPNTTIWDGGRFALAMPDGIKIDEALIRQRFNDPKLASALKETGFASPDVFLQSFVMGPEDVKQYVGMGLILTDDHPYIEYDTFAPQDTFVPLSNRDIKPYLIK